MPPAAETEPIVISIDAGTTGVRAFAVDSGGRPIGRSYREFTQYFPEPGWVEHDAEEIWQTVVTVLGDLITELGQPVGAIGITNQRETAIAWDRRTGRALGRAIVWQDRRTAARCEQLTASGHLAQIRSTTGLVLDPYFSATKFEWLLSNGVAPNADLMLGTVDSWIIWNLTGGRSHVTDPSNAARTMLYDIGSLSWSPDLCELFGVPIEALPTVEASIGEAARTAEIPGVPSGVPISGIAGDQQAALFGQACLKPGMAKNTYGTGSFVLMNTGEVPPPVSEGLLNTVAWTAPGRIFGRPEDSSVTHYAMEGSIFVTGAAVQWLRDGLGLIDSASEVGPLAESVESTDGVVFVPAFTGLGSPYWDPYARGSIFGITRGSTRAHLARAVVEAMAYQTRDVVEAMSVAAGFKLSELRVDGGASAMDLLLQIQADQLACEVARASVSETTALGAAYMAGLGAGIWSDTSDIDQCWEADARFSASDDRSAANAGYQIWKRAIESSLDWDGPSQHAQHD